MKFDSLFWRVLLNETGQMSIFIAIIFQVLFVFFAMVVNIGLLVHDKINLQNAVDLAAYYGAQRQAEIMNEIAHINYQIRQDYKLLAWRYRVMGTLGRVGTGGSLNNSTLPPARRSDPGSLTDKKFVNPDYGDEPPSVCVSNEMWKQMVENSDQDENYCFNKYGSNVPKIPDVVVIADFVPAVSSSRAFTQMAQQNQKLSCQNAGPRNWVFAMQMIFGYKLAVATRKEIIWELRRNLISAEFKDRNNESVREGVLVTLRKNLTVANQEGFQPDGFQFLNGLSDANCNRGDDGEFILPEVQTAPAIVYTTYDCSSGSTAFMAGQADTSLLDQGQVQNFDPSGLYRNLAKGEPERTNPYHSTLGFEKNPWCMAYVGVKAKTVSQKPFAPFGKPITLEARAFAQPFGGRIGPWYKERWSRTSPTSSDGARVDPLTSPRQTADGGLDTANRLARLPNYSRYPGDTLGLQSEITLGGQNSQIRQYGPPAASKGDRLDLQWYANFDQIPSTGDVVVTNGNPNFPLRRAEVAAVVPDLFDATYYSIDPNYVEAYVKTGSPERISGAPAIFGRAVRQLPDVGGSLDGNGIRMSVENQIAQSAQGGFDTAVFPKIYYALRSWTHLLTGWASNRVQNFEFPSDRFGICKEVASDQVMIPGKCAAGGRTGYSVRLISKSHLTFGGWKVGGEGEAEGPILNPPADDF